MHLITGKIGRRLGTVQHYRAGYRDEQPPKAGGLIRACGLRNYYNPAQVADLTAK